MENVESIIMAILLVIVILFTVGTPDLLDSVMNYVDRLETLQLLEDAKGSHDNK